MRAVNVNTANAREAAKALPQDYFRVTRPDLRTLGFADDELEQLDQLMQRLLELANGRNPKRSYIAILRSIRATTQAFEVSREYRLGERRESDNAPTLATPVEQMILRTLRDLVPTAALSYEQALRDLANSNQRVSFRGTANELREALREVIDRLAPDEAVIAASGFKFEKDRTQPTQKQKVRYILRSRNVSETARKAPESAVALVEEHTGVLARASYERSSLSTHIATTEQEVRQMKMYVDGILGELLQIHA